MSMAASLSTGVRGTKVWNIDATDQKTYNEVDLETTWNGILDNVFGQNNEKITVITKDNERNVEIFEEVRCKPTLVISVIGDTENYVPTIWPTCVFQTALIEAAKNGGETLILHRESDNGLSKVIRNAYLNYEIMEFGEKAVDINDSQRRIKLISVAGEKIDQQQTQLEKPNIYRCESGRGERFLLSFEKFVSKQNIFYFGKNIDFKIPIPIVIIACEGDIETIAHISEALQNKLPVIIVKGSGKAADLVLDYLHNRIKILQSARVLLGIEFEDAKYTELKLHLQKIKRNRHLVSIFDLDQDDPLMLLSIIGNTIVSCKSMQNTIQQPRNEFRRWKNERHREKRKPEQPMVFPSFDETLNKSTKIDKDRETRPHVLNPSYATPTSLPLYFYFGYQLLQESNSLEKFGDVLLFEAIKMNRCDYVTILLDRGIKFNMDNFFQLYEQTLFAEKDNQYANKISSEFKNIKRTRRENMDSKGNTEKNVRTSRDRELSFSVREAAKTFCHKHLECRLTGTETEDDFIADILLWAILVNRREVAEILWLRGTDHLLKGVICSAILKKLSELTNERLLKEDLKEHSTNFEQRCVRIMDEMYKENRERAICFMEDLVDVWGIHSCPLEIAHESNLLDVVAHVCSERIMDMHWYHGWQWCSDFKKTETHLTQKHQTAETILKWFCKPITKFGINNIFEFAILMMYSIFVLTSIDTIYNVRSFARIFEYSVYFWTAGNLIESYIQTYVYIRKRGTNFFQLWIMLQKYGLNIWVYIDTISYLLLFSAMFVRHLYEDETFTIARRLFALALLAMYFRFFRLFLVNKRLGITVIMIEEMLKDIGTFALIAVITVVGVGVYYHANIWPDHQTMLSGDVANWRIWFILLYPYWQLYGELDIESIDGSDQTDCSNLTSVWESDPSIKRCPQEDWTVPLITAIYMLFSNLLLVNIVIAKFSSTITKVQANSKKLWHYRRYTLIKEFDWRIPSPINIPTRIYQSILLVCSCYCTGQGFGKKSVSDVASKQNKEKAWGMFRLNFQRIIAFRNYNNDKRKNTQSPG